jgi:hypothetical protein
MPQTTTAAGAPAGALDAYRWWAALRHEGIFLAPQRLAAAYPAAPEAPLAPRVAERLRAALVNAEQEPGLEEGLLDVVLGDVCGFGVPGGTWQRLPALSTAWSVRAASGEVIRPRRVYEGPHRTALPVFTETEARLGVGRSRRTVARVLEWLRAQERPLALLTNGRQWRLVHAGADHHASVEWDTALWFEEGRPGAQVDALRLLLDPARLTPEERGRPAPLMAAILASRRGQAELSAELGERVRQGVELLVQAYGAPLAELLARDGSVSTAHVYLASTRVVMRAVVVLFAEARDGLLPTSERAYAESYGIQGAARTAGRHPARAPHAAARGVAAPARAVPSHRRWLGPPRAAGAPLRGRAVRRGAADAADPVARALALLESARHAPDDDVVARLLELLTRTRVAVRQGGATQVVTVPVDFSDLSSEYIGILYEGLLDFELRHVRDDASRWCSSASGPSRRSRWTRCRRCRRSASPT